MSQFSLNNRLIVEVYKTDKSLRAEVKNGFAMVDQKVTLKGLRILMPATLANGKEVPAGSIAYIKEEILHNAPWAKTPLKADTMSEQFLVIDASVVDFIYTPPTDPAA